MNTPQNLREAEFDPKVCTYWLLKGVALLASVIGIVLTRSGS